MEHSPTMLWNVFWRSKPRSVLIREVYMKVQQNERKDLEFSIKSHKNISTVDQVNGVDLFAVLTVLYRTRQLSYLSGE